MVVARYIAAMLVGAVAVLGAGRAWGQMSAPPAATAEMPPIRESGPPVMYLKNKEGQLIVVPSLTIEQLDELLQLDRGIVAREPPRFTFEDTVLLTGAVIDAAVDLDTQIVVRVTPGVTATGEWLRVPLRFHQAILTAPVALHGDGEIVTEYQGSGEGYIVWLRTTGAAEYRLSLKLKVPVTVANNEKRLTLSVPNRSTRLELAMSSADARARVSDDSGNILLPAQKASEGPAHVVVESPGGTLDLFWRDAPEPSPVLQADASVLVRLAGRTFDAEALLRVRSFGAPLDSFTIRLPPEVHWPGPTLTGPSGVQISQVGGNAHAGGKNGQLLLVRRLEGNTLNPLEVRLRVTGTGTGTAAASTIDLSGFEVGGARIQRGTLDFMVEGDWSVSWQTDENVRRVDVPDAVRPQQVMARFEYDRQPFTLRVMVGRGAPRVNVDPTYVVTVESEQLKLEASLRYRVNSARADKLLIDTGGWVIERVGPVEVLAGPWKVDKTTIEIPVSVGSLANRGEFELQLAARQSIDRPELSWLIPNGSALFPGLLALRPVFEEAWMRSLAGGPSAREVSFVLPRPAATAATPGVVVISPADNIELSPLVDRLQWLVADSLPPQVKLPARQQPPLVYREDTVGQPASFAAVIKVRRREISAVVDSRIRVDEREWKVEQKFAMFIGYEPASRLTFDVPKSLLASGKLEVLLDGSPAIWSWENSASDERVDRQLGAVTFRERRIGACEILFRSWGLHGRVLSEVGSTMSVPLVHPVEAEVTELRSSGLRLVSPASIRLSLVDDELQPLVEESASAAAGNEIVYSLESLPSQVAIAAQATDASGRRSTTIERVWVQSLLTRSERRDRACFRLKANHGQLSFTLPFGAGTEDVSVVVDGVPSERFVVTADRQVRVDLGDVSVRRQFTVELTYWFTAQPALLGQIYLQAPQLAGASRPGQLYWELRLPANEHLAWATPDLISENAWLWRPFFLARTPRLGQKDLERWVQGASLREESGFNTYVFSSVGSLGPKSVITILRPVAIMIIAGGVFAAGVLWLYVSALHHRLLLLVVGMLLVVTAAVFPEPTIAAAQAIVLGVTLVALTRLLRSLFVRRPAVRIAPRGSTYSVSESRSSRTMSRAAESHPQGGSGVNAPTVSAPYQMSATGNEP